MSRVARCPRTRRIRIPGLYLRGSIARIRLRQHRCIHRDRRWCRFLRRPLQYRQRQNANQQLHSSVAHIDLIEVKTLMLRVYLNLIRPRPGCPPKANLTRQAIILWRLP